MKTSRAHRALLALLAGSAAGVAPQAALAQCADPFAVIRADDPATLDLFGTAVSLHAGTGTAAVAMIGVPKKDIGGLSSTGKVYSFGKFSNTQWGLLTTIVSPTPAQGALFGNAIASNSSVMLVGAPGTASSDGAVHVFRRPGVDWEQIQRLDAPFPSGAFGSAIAMSGNTAVIGAPDVDIDGFNGAIIDRGGNAYLYSRNTNTGIWTRTETFVEPIAAQRGTFDRFGAAVEYIGTGYVAIGIPGRDVLSPQSNTNVANAGAVRIYGNTTSGWVPWQVLTSGFPTFSAQFGSSIKMSGVWMAVAAPADGNAGTNAGAVYMYKRTGTTFNHVETLYPSAPAANAFFGSSISLDGDNLVVAASTANQVYTFRRVGDHWAQDRRISSPDGGTFGSAVALLGSDFIVTDTQQNIGTATVAGEALAYRILNPQADLCADAIPVGLGSFSACTDAAGVDAPGAAPCLSGTQNAPDVWWSFTNPSPVTSMIEISTEGSSFDTVLSVHTGCPATAANAVACNDDISTVVRQSKLRFMADPNVSYLVRGSGYNGASGSLSLSISAVQSCYANCDESTVAPVLNAGDFSCFLTKFRQAASLSFSQQIASYANCDQSTVAPVLNAGDFSCFLAKFRAGCP